MSPFCYWGQQRFVRSSKTIAVPVVVTLTMRSGTTVLVTSKSAPRKKKLW
jgi:hypothetical protein